MFRPALACSLVVGMASLAQAQEVDRAKVETQAAGQAAEADRLFKAGEFGSAMALYDAERASRAALGDIRYEAYANRAIGICKAELGDDEGAIEALARARVLDNQREDKGYAGFDLFLISQAEVRLDRPLDAIKTLEIALPLLSQAIDRDHECDAHLFFTRILLNLGRAGEARPHVARAMLLADELKDAWRIGDGWAASGQIEGALGNLSLALERFADAEEIFEQEGRAGEAAWMETISGSTLAMLGRFDLALAHFEEAARRHEHIEAGGDLAEDLSAIAGLQLEANQLDAALVSARKAVDKAQEVDDRPREVEARVRLAQVQGKKNDWSAAAATLDEAVLLVRQVARDDPAEQIRLLLTAAATDMKANQKDRAKQRYDQAGQIADEAKIPALRQIVDDARGMLVEPVTPRTPAKPGP